MVNYGKLFTKMEMSTDKGTLVSFVDTPGTHVSQIFLSVSKLPEYDTKFF